MTHTQKTMALQYTKEIVEAKLSNTNTPPTKEGGEQVADFMEQIYNKFVELINKKDAKS